MNLKFSKQDLKPLLASFQRLSIPLIKYHVFIITMIVLGFLIYGVYTANSLLNIPKDQAYYDQKLVESLPITFDQETISKIEQLEDGQQGINLSLPGGRINPFAE